MANLLLDTVQAPPAGAVARWGTLAEETRRVVGTLPDYGSPDGQAEPDSPRGPAPRPRRRVDLTAEEEEAITTAVAKIAREFGPDHAQAAAVDYLDHLAIVRDTPGGRRPGIPNRTAAEVTNYMFRAARKHLWRDSAEARPEDAKARARLRQMETDACQRLGRGLTPSELAGLIRQVEDDWEAGRTRPTRTWWVGNRMVPFSALAGSDEDFRMERVEARSTPVFSGDPGGSDDGGDAWALHTWASVALLSERQRALAARGDLGVRRAWRRADDAGGHSVLANMAWASLAEGRAPMPRRAALGHTALYRHVFGPVKDAAGDVDGLSERERRQRGVRALIEAWEEQGPDADRAEVLFVPWEGVPGWPGHRPMSTDDRDRVIDTLMSDGGSHAGDLWYSACWMCAKEHEADVEQVVSDLHAVAAHSGLTVERAAELGEDAFTPRHRPTPPARA